MALLKAVKKYEELRLKLSAIHFNRKMKDIIFRDSLKMQRQYLAYFRSRSFEILAFREQTGFC